MYRQSSFSAFFKKLLSSFARTFIRERNRESRFYFLNNVLLFHITEIQPSSRVALLLLLPGSFLCVCRSLAGLCVWSLEEMLSSLVILNCF